MHPTLEHLSHIYQSSSVHPELWSEGCDENLGPINLGSARRLQLSSASKGEITPQLHLAAPLTGAQFDKLSMFLSVTLISSSDPV